MEVLRSEGLVVKRCYLPFLGVYARYGFFVV